MMGYFPISQRAGQKMDMPTSMDMISTQFVKSIYLFY